MSQDIHNYDDIINLPHHISKKHPQMSLEDRAAQFAPFAALTGHKEAVNEQERLTEKKKILDEDQKEIINHVLQQIADEIQKHPLVKVTYFIPDSRKSGGSYTTLNTQIIKVNVYENQLLCKNGIKISVDDIYNIEIL